MFETVMREGIRSLQKLSADDVLEVLGLQRRRSFESLLLPTAAVFAVGAVVGAAATALLTPKSGPVMRKELLAGAKDLSQRLGTTANSVVHNVRDALPASTTEQRPRNAGPQSAQASGSAANALQGGT